MGSAIPDSGYSIRMESIAIPESWEDADAADAAPPLSNQHIARSAQLAARAEELLQSVRQSQVAVEEEVARLERSHDPSPVAKETPAPTGKPSTRSRGELNEARDAPPFLLLVNIQRFAALLRAHGDGSLEDSLLHSLHGSGALERIAVETTQRLLAAMAGALPSPPLEAMPPAISDDSTDAGTISFEDRGSSEVDSATIRAVLLSYGCPNARRAHRTYAAPLELKSTCKIIARENAGWAAPAGAFCAAAEALLSAGVAFHAHDGTATFDALAIASSTLPAGRADVYPVHVLCLRYPQVLHADRDGGGTQAVAVDVAGLARELGCPWEGCGSDAAVAAAADVLRSLIEGAHRDVLWKVALWRVVRSLATAEEAAAACVTESGAGLESSRGRQAAWWDLPVEELAASPLVRLLPSLLDRQLPQPHDTGPLLPEESAADAYAGAVGGGDDGSLEAAQVRSAAAALHAAALAVGGGSSADAPPAPWIDGVAWEAATLIDAWVAAFGRVPPSSSLPSATPSSAAVPAAPVPPAASEGAARKPASSPHTRAPPAPQVATSDDRVGPSLDDMQRGLFAVRAPRLGAGAGSAWGASGTA